MTPTIMSVLHVLEPHTHNICDDETTHLHDVSELSCEICDFHLSSFWSDDIIFFDVIKYTNIEREYPVVNAQNIYFLSKNNFHLRAPPYTLS